MTIDWTNPAYLMHGTPRQRDAWRAIQSLGVFERLGAHTPVLTGTIPLNLDVADSDLDFICAARDLEALADLLRAEFGGCEGFRIRIKDVNGTHSVVANFVHGGFPFEMFGQARPVTEQRAYRHLVVEARLLAIGGDVAHRTIRRLRAEGLKTEPAFARYFGLAGDPYETLLELGALGEEDLRDAIGRSPAPAATLNRIYLADNLTVLSTLADGFIDLIYIDPPFNTGRAQTRTRLRTIRSATGDRTGFQGARYATVKVGTQFFTDLFDDYLAFLEPRLREAYRVLAPHGSLYVHVDYREAHYVKVLLDAIFGRDCFLNEIIWAYDYGGRTRKKWPPKHDTILLYVKDPKHYTFNIDAVERIPYMAPGLVGPEKAARGKTPTDVWWHTIVPTSGKERTGYPTQKPLGILRRIVQASSHPGDLMLDFFAGSGTAGAACLELSRRFILVDNNPQALAVMARRFAGVPAISWVGFDPDGSRRDEDVRNGEINYEAQH